ncbi:short-chain dehydrogenase/reductase [Herbaspirillum sp. meg3]|uniref:oxidoreductase n=1 Tax=Herbaspirillum sp. meg3 TaxID=2025949 RepID=UPI000B992EDC|nr:oxidoreductase [Herbaspirillum sp. meg3]ASU41188.1 short-chain dehydrogenase/reductase [Herbaspirillum sp. meg3]
MSASKTFFITGVSSGFGRALSQAAIDAGHRVIGTVRNAAAASDFEAQFSATPGRAFARILDVTDFAAAEKIAADVEAAIGPVDVLVNNAGYGHEGIFEESGMDALQRQFDVNVFGAVAVTKSFVPFMRQRRRGHIINITSMGGFITMPGIAYYCGSKFALEGISETLGKELKAFNVFVTAVAPGSFRTDWAGRSMVRSPRSVADYDALFDPIRNTRAERSGMQPGDPRKAAQAMLTLVDSPSPPAHLLLGSDALGLVRKKLAELTQELAQWEALTCSTDAA